MRRGCKDKVRPPAVNCEATSAKQAMMTPAAAPASRTAQGLAAPDQPGNIGRQAENPAADDRVDHQRCQTPAPNRAYQSGSFSFRHRVFVSQEAGAGYRTSDLRRRNSSDLGLQTSDFRPQDLQPSAFNLRTSDF